MDDLIVELFNIILSNLKPVELGLIRSVCRRWRKIIPLDKNVMINAAMEFLILRDIRLVKYVISLGSSFIPDEFAVKQLIKNNDLDCLKWLYHELTLLPIKITYSACKYDKVEILKWSLLKTGYVSSDAARVAAVRGHLDVLKILYGWDIEDFYHGVQAARTNHEHVLKWALEIYGKDIWGLIALEAIIGGNLELLKRIEDRSFLKHSCTTSHGVRAGNWKVFKWLIDNGCNPHGASCLSFEGGRGGNRNIIEGVEVNAFGWRGKWNDTAWVEGSSQVFAGLIEGNHLGLLKENLLTKRWDSCGFIDRLVFARIGDVKMIKFVIQQGLYSCIDHCSRSKKLNLVKLVKWAERHHVKYNPVSILKRFARQNNIERFRWFLENRVIWDNDICEKVVKKGGLKIIQWCIVNGFIQRVQCECIFNKLERRKGYLTFWFYGDKVNKLIQNLDTFPV